MTGRHLTFTASLLALGCGSSASLEEGHSNVVGGVRTFERPEIGTTGGCTATLIQPNVAITAAHCWGYASRSAAGSYGTFRIDLSEGNARRYTISRYHSFGSGLGTDDVTLLLLQSAVPPDVAKPATLADREPARGAPNVIWGYGCTSQSNQVGGGVKRVVELSYGSTDNLCPGDSGGPATVGKDGPIWGINSSYGYSDGFGRPYTMLDRITAKVVEWNGRFIPPGVDTSADKGPPTVSLVAPEADALRPERSTVEVRAEIGDDLGIGRAELVWDYNGNTYGCPTNVQYVKCEVNGDMYIWSVEVSTGKRVFRVQAFDVVGNHTVSEDRTIHLGNPPPPPDTAPPTVSILSPATGTRFDPSTQLQVVAEVTDDQRVAEVSLIWDFNGYTYACPSQNGNVSCAVSGSRYTWTLSLSSEADRAFRVRAVDGAGKRTESETRTVSVRAVRDTQAPSIEILSPGDGESLVENSEIVVRARVTDDTRVSAATLEWRYNSQSYGCPSSSQWVQCTVQGDEYTWRVKVSTGERRFSFTARDPAGNRATTPERRVTLRPPSQGAPTPPEPTPAPPPPN